VSLNGASHLIILSQEKSQNTVGIRKEKLNIKNGIINNHEVSTERFHVDSANNEVTK